VTSCTYTQIQSPIGDLTLGADADGALTGLYMDVPGRPPPISGNARADFGPFAGVAEQLDEYFAGERHSFDVELRMAGTEFQRSVWDALRGIEYGETVSYGEIARRIDRPDEARAVGAANGANPVSIIVPCHRVIGADGSLTGYGGGLDRKRFLLELEHGVAALGV
jgi:methylated-DNA-[protein]-cysteine S-methyltransferase